VDGRTPAVSTPILEAKHLSNAAKNAYLLLDKGVEYTTLLAGYFKARYTELGGTIALEDQYDDKATDFSAQIAKVKALPTQPDFYYVAAMPYNIGPVVKQFRDAGLTGPI
jgi:branched-chain amino acid transport system substrate-binding protein